MKRVVLTLFAALCVGSVWAAETSMTITNFAVSDSGVVSFDYALSYTGSSTKRMARIVMTYGRRCGEMRSINIKKETSTNNDGFLNPKSTASGSYTSASLDISPNDYWVKIAFYMERTSGAGDYTKTEVFIPQNDNVIIPNEVQTYLTHNSETPVKFVVSGAVSSVASEVTGVVIKYGFGTLSEENPLSATASYNPTTKLYTCDIYSSSKTDVLHYNIYSVSAVGEKIYYDVENNVTLLKEQHYEQPYMSYTWTGLGSDNSWDNDNNWDSGTTQCWGYPGHYTGYPKATSGYYTSRARFTNSTVRVNLNNKTFMPYEQDDEGGGKNKQFRGLVFEKPANCQKMNVVFENGAINIKIPSSCGPSLLGQSDVNLEFNNATFGVTTSPNLLVPNANSTIIFSGERDHAWNFAPRGDYSKNFKLIFKNFYGSTYYDSGLTVASGSVIEITNAVWRVRTGKNNTSTASKGFATKVILRDGDTYPAQLKCFAYYSGDDRWADINLNNTYDIKIPAAGHEDASIFAKNLTEAPTATFEIDVSDYDKGAKVPIVELLGGEPAFTTLPTLVAKANGQDVTTARNARLFWDGNFMYFQQDSLNAAEVGGVEYATFAEAFAAAEDGATVKLLNDVTLVEKLTVKKAVTLDLNGCTLSETVTDSYGAIYIGTAGNLTITDSATGGKIATDGGIVIGNYGTVTVAGGTIEAGAVAEEDASVYNFYYNGSTYGKLTVNGGKVGRIWNCGNANITAGEVVDIDNSGAMTIAEAVTVSGSVVIKDGSDAADVPGAGTLTAPESLTVQVGTEGAEAFYVDGKWLAQVVVATIGEAKFASLDAAIAAAGAADTIILVKDIELTSFISIAKSLTLDLNGKSINRADGTALYVNGDATVTIQGEGSVSGAQAVYVGAGTVVIKGGNFHGYNGGHAVYVQGTGNVEILDGTFSIDEDGTYDYVLNEYDQTRDATSIVVKGGKFKNFNPANNGAEGANTDFCAEGLCGYVVETVDGVDFYGVAAAVATVGEAKFATLDAAIAAAGAEDEVFVVADIATDAAFEITKKVAINLNGKTIATTQADTEGNGVFWVKAGGELTLNGEGTVNGVGGNAYNIAIWADGGKVIINGGTYTNEGAQDDGPDGAHFDLIYVKNGGAVEINGGMFKCQTPEWTLNSHDTKKGTIVVNGGLFYQFNPSDCATEGAGTNWCAEGLKGAESAENAGYYEIVDAWTAPMPEKDGEADITEEYTPDVLAALEAAVATSVDVKVNGVELKGNEAVKGLNAAVKCFDGALTFDGTAASVDIVIEVTEVNVDDPAASTVVVKRGTEELTVKATPTVKYFYPETKTWGSDKPESGAVLFKLVF